MDKTTNPKFPKRVIISIGCIVAVVAVIGFILSGDNNESHTFSNEPFGIFSSQSSGPFSVDSTQYNVGDKITLKGSKIPFYQFGEAVFIQPDGKVHHTFPIDGSRKPSVNHYFKLMPHTTKDCIPHEYVGTWQISFKTFQGDSYNPITFDVTDSRINSNENTEPC